MLQGYSVVQGRTPAFQNAGCVTGKETALMAAMSSRRPAAVNIPIDLFKMSSACQSAIDERSLQVLL